MRAAWMWMKMWSICQPASTMVCLITSVCGDCDRAFPDANSSNSGLYELQAVLTHKGASSNSGHYVAWVRQSNGGLRSLPLIIRLGVTGRDRLAAL